MLLSGVHHTKNKNLKLSNVVEDDEWKSGNRPVPQTVINRRTPIGICCQFERRGFHAFKEFHSQPNLMSVVPVRGRHYIRMKKGMVSNLVLTVWHLGFFSKLRRESIRLLDPLAFRLADALLPQTRNSAQGFAHRLKQCHPKSFG
jgi:hypothetical protein